MSSSASLIELLKSCGLEHRAKLFEDEGYTLDVAKTAVRDDQATMTKPRCWMTCASSSCQWTSAGHSWRH